MRTRWDRPKLSIPDLDTAINRFQRYLIDHGYRPQSIDDYCRAIDLYLRTVKKSNPIADDATNWFSSLAASEFAGSTVNQRRAALLASYRSLGLEMKLPYLKPTQEFLFSFMKAMSSEFSIIFMYWKERAGIIKPGSVHVFGRHTPASIMVKNGCDVYSLQQLMRHNSIKTTARYLHTDIATLREKQSKFLDE